MMLKVMGECPKNPRQTGHCMHDNVQTDGRGALMLSRRCCWCGHYEQQQVRLPDHGEYVKHGE